jgi:AcrR family transcriptional regulator
MATSAKRVRDDAGHLNRERVLQCAVQLADKEGIASLSMRKLGQQLHVEAMSLYYHVRNKNDILDGMIDIVFSEITLPALGVDWKTAMRERAISARHVLLQHPWAINLMESRIQGGSMTLRHHDAVLGSLRQARFSIELAAHAYSVLDAYIYGFTLQELTLLFQTPEEVTAVAGTVLERLPTAEYPYLAEMIVDHAMKPGYYYGDEFAFGLDLILDGLERRHETT